MFDFVFMFVIKIKGPPVVETYGFFFYLLLPSQTATKQPSDEIHLQKHGHHGRINWLAERPVHFKAFKASFNQMVVRLDSWDLIHHNWRIDWQNIHKIVIMCMICTMAVKVIMVFEWDFIYEFGNSLRNFPIPIELSIQPSKVHNTTTPPTYDFVGPKQQTFLPNNYQIVVQYECKYITLNGSM